MTRLAALSSCLAVLAWAGIARAQPAPPDLIGIWRVTAQLCQGCAAIPPPDLQVEIKIMADSFKDPLSANCPANAAYITTPLGAEDRAALLPPADAHAKTAFLVILECAVATPPGPPPYPPVTRLILLDRNHALYPFEGQSTLLLRRVSAN
ncbi:MULTISPECIES: hypothetical protein [unclassified Acidocella]|uniref:hypothetical protein n=1 Tax=unclassified Acidocella TaxID=2648610 RepID=UPI0003499D8F|nr:MULTISPECIES: hypothetical protein [unclassified Acidocella]WBO57936.1 hypothetical protein GT370_11630 [Acidocella sp. MX-AZ03]